MKDVSLQALLEAGCHFGHKAEKWHPKTSSYIFTKKDGIHIIDLAQTKECLEKAGNEIAHIVQNGGEVLFVGTKRQAKQIIKDQAGQAGAPYLSHHWIGGFLTNWESVKKNIDKINSMETAQTTGGWKRYPKHEQVKMARYLSRIKVYYEGVQKLTRLPEAIVIVDTRKERSAVKEASRVNMHSIAIVDTNSDPSEIDCPIPANDDALGSIEIIISYLASCYKQAKDKYVSDKEQKEKKERKEDQQVGKEVQKTGKISEQAKVDAKTEIKAKKPTKIEKTEKQDEIKEPKKAKQTAKKSKT